MPSPGANRSFSLRAALQIAALAAAYFALAKLSLELAIPPGYASAVWPPSGLALAALLLGGPRLWPGVLIGAGAANYTIQFSVPLALAIGVGNTLEAVAAVWLVRALGSGAAWPFVRPQQVFGLAAVALLSGLVAASVASLALVLAGALSQDLQPTWFTWWLGDAAGMIIVAPLLLAWAGTPAYEWTRARVAELALVALLLAATSAVVFFGWASGGRALPIEFLVLPILLWVALRFTEREVATACALAAAFAVFASAEGSGPFSSGNVNLTLLLTQAFLSTLVITALALNATVSALRRISERLRRAREELEQFVDTAAHDLQEPLRNILSFSDLLNQRYGARLDRDGGEFLGYVVDGATRLRRRIEDLLAVARAGRATLRAEAADSGAALAAALGSLRALVEGTQASITHDALPQVHADPRMLESLFQNLVGNALKFRGPEAPRIHVGARRAGELWEFSVQDNGIGIEPRYHGLIFEMFERLGRGYSDPSSGVGLAICRRIVERHGGRIWVKSALSEGATFSFTLPAAGGGKNDGT